MKAKDLVGKKFGKLTVIKRSADHMQPSGKKIVAWTCECECGSIKDVMAQNLLSGCTTSCGCYSRAVRGESLRARRIKHGKSGTRLYKIWTHMISRCENPRDISYKNYGDAGIKVCEEWKDFENFERWAKQNGYSKDLSIDRINPRGDYESNNCRWATRYIQDRNKTNNINLTYDGKTMCMADWSKELGIPFTTMLARFRKNKSTEEILSKSKLARRGRDGKWQAM